MGGNYEKSVYNQLMEVMSRLDAFEKEHKQKVTLLNEEITDLKRENKQLREENQLLRDDNARLKSILNNDSSNSSMPPSSDHKGGKPANTYNGREKTERKAGGQKGRRGNTLTKADIEEKIRSGKCHHEILTVGTPQAEEYVTKYVIDIRTETVVTEVRIYAGADGKFNIPEQYRSDVTYGGNIKALAAMLYAEGVMSNDRIAAFLNAAGGDALELSEGSIYHFCKKLSRNSEESIAHLEESLSNQTVVATDATAVMVNGKQNYIRSFSTEETVVYHAMDSKSIPALKKIGFLAGYSGILVHDHETALYHFGTDHAECNVHIIRYLRKNTEETGNHWSDGMIALLCGMNQARKELLWAGSGSFSKEELAGYEEEYHGLIRKGREENKKTSRRYAKSDEKSLLNRMEKYAHNHLLFLYDFAIPFGNNISERDLRKAKNRQKMAGGFRKESGQQMYCSILTVIETLKRRNMGILENIRQLFMGTPAIF